MSQATIAFPPVPVIRKTLTPIGVACDPVADLLSGGLTCVVTSNQNEALRIWRQLDAELPLGLSTSMEWVECWLKHYGHLVQPRFLIGIANTGVPSALARPVGICLLPRADHQRLGPFRLATAHLGTAGEPAADSPFVEYNRILVQPSHRVEFLRGIWRHLENDPVWDRFELPGMVRADADELMDMLPPTRVRRVPAWYMDLRECRETGVSPGERIGKSTRRNLRQMERSLSACSVEWADSLGTADSILADLISQHQARWTSAGHPGVFASRSFVEFHRDLISRLLPRKKVALVRVRSGARVIGCLYNFVEHNRLLVYQTSSEAFERGFFPGILRDVQVMEEACRRGYDAFDFMGGDAENKRRLSSHQNELVWAVCQRPRPKFRVAHAAKWLRDWLSGEGRESRRDIAGTENPVPCD